MLLVDFGSRSVAAAMSHCKTPSPKYVTSVYKCWYCNKAEVEKSLGNNIINIQLGDLLAVKHNCDEKRLDMMRKDHEDEVNDHGDNEVDDEQEGELDEL